MTFQPSPQQQNVFNWVSAGSGNAFVVAVAGAGKTTTILNAVDRMSGDVAFCAYNKKIAVEISEKLAKRARSADFKGIVIRDDLKAQAGTFHSFGFKAWRAAKKNVQLDERAKWDAILQDIEPAYHDFVKKLVSLAKDSAFGVTNPRLGAFPNPADVRAWYKLIMHHSMMEMLEEGMTVEQAVKFCQQALAKSIELADSLIDYADMIYMPILKLSRLVPWCVFDWLLVDEAQDTNPARRALARLMTKPTSRLIFVGDPAQAIYGFTGADNDSVDQIIRDFKCTELPLTVTYRCPKAVVMAAQAYVSHIEAHESAPQGIVEEQTEDQFDAALPHLKPADAILCRKTKPLVAMAYKLIRNRIACHVEGKEIGTGLIKLTTKWKRVKTIDTFLEKLEEWTAQRVKKFMEKGQDTQAEAAQDRYDTMVVICQGKKDMDEVRAFIAELFQDTEDGKPSTNVTLSTVHKSKGREWGTVFVLGFKAYMPSPYATQAWEKEQERNLIYVAFTRAQFRLVLID